MRSAEVSFDSDGCAMAGTFTEATAPVAAALLVTGSGRINRDSDMRGLRLGVTRAVAEALADAQVSTLRYDKRGVGASGGDYLRTGMDQRFADARAGLGWLADHAPGLPLLLVGHSEGTLYAARLAGEDGVAGVVLLSGPARPGSAVLTWQTEQLATRLPWAAKVFIRVTRTDVVRTQRRRMGRIRASRADVMRVQGVRINARWIRDFAAYDPAPALARITVPVLAITGGQDLQVPPEDVEAVGRLVGGPFEGHVPEGISHLLRPDPQGTGPRGYRRAVRQPVGPEVLGLVTDWVAEHWQAPGVGTP